MGIVCFLFDIRTGAFEGLSQLFDDVLHFGSDAVALLAGLGLDSLRMFVFLGDEWVTLPSRQLLFLMISP